MPHKTITQKEYSARIHCVLDYITKNLAEDLTLEKLSEISCFSPYHFHRIFTAFINERPAEYITRLRLEKAASMLVLFPEIPVTDVALKSGFSSPSTFARAFKQYFACSSTEWREGGYEEYKNSKKGKIDIKNREAIPLHGFYVSEENNQSLKGESMNGEIKEMPAFHIAYVANLEGYNDKIAAAYDKLCKWAGPRGLLNPSTKYMGMSLDDPEITPEDKCRFYACISVPPNIASEGDIQVMDLPAGRYAVTHFDGPEDGISRAYKVTYGEFIPQSGYLPGDSYSYEIYYNDPGIDKKFVMDICVPIKLL